MAERHIVIVGGGIVGLSAAYFLARRGARVTVIERDPIGDGASSGNAGILALGHPPLPRPGLPGRLARLLFDETNPLYIRPRFDPALAAWIVRFLRASNHRDYARSLDVLCRVGWEAGHCFRDLVETESIECEYHPTGWLEVFRTRRALDEARHEAARLRSHGYTVEERTGEELRAHDAAFAEDVVGALHFTDSAFANPRRFVLGLAEAAARHGATLTAGATVATLDTRGGRFAGVTLADGSRIEADRAVLAAGAWTTPLARTAGIRVPMQAGKGYHVDLVGVPAVPSTTCVLAETFVAVTPLDGGLRLAGTVELSGLDLEVSQRRVDMLRVGARRYLNGIDTAEARSTWCGLRPLTADGLPVVGDADGVAGVFVATGHAMMGFLLGPLSGRLAAESILDGKMSVEVPEFRADRF